VDCAAVRSWAFQQNVQASSWTELWLSNMRHRSAAVLIERSGYETAINQCECRRDATETAGLKTT
jgi:hypothetical protein